MIYRNHLYPTPPVLRKPLAAKHIRRVACWTLAIWIMVSSAPSAKAAGKLTLEVRDRDTGELVAVRMVVTGPRGNQMSMRRLTPAGVGVAVNGSADLEVPNGTYQFRLVRGPEYRIMTGSFLIERAAEDTHTITLERYVDTQKENWLAGDLFVDRNLKDLPILMRSEDLDVVALITNRTDGKKSKASLTDTIDDELLQGLDVSKNNIFDAREGSGLLMLEVPGEFPKVDPKAPSGTLLRESRQANVGKLVVQNPFAWDLPIWLASNRVSAFMLMSDHLQLDREVKRVQRGRAPSERGFDDALGLGLWADEVYRNILEAGFQIPPVAGSGIGLVPNPIGYNRVYVQCGDSPNIEKFWEGLWQGRSTLSNGPILRPRLEGEYPGHVFESYDGNPLELQMDLQLGTRDPVDYLEVIHNNVTIYSARLEEFKNAKGIIPRFTFKESGWVMARVVTGYEKHYRAAVSAPWYIQIGPKKRVSREAVEFFQQWLADREALLRKKPPEYIQAVAPFIRASREFWKTRLEAATDD